LLNRRPPFGLDVLSSLKEYPRHHLSITENEVQSDGGKNPVQIELSVACTVMDEEKSSVRKAKKQKGRSFQMTAVLTLTSNNDLIDLRRIP
jgi:ATP-dependent DNA helicase HFM1/MER3